MPTLEIVMPSLHQAQAEVHRHPARFKVLACGRRFGKTLLGTAECTGVGLEGGKAWWVAPSYPMAKVGWDGLKVLARQIPGAEVREQDREVRYPGRGWARVRSADDPQSLRGEGLDLVVLDEFAYMKPAAWTQALRPALTDRQGRAIFISTPKGPNLFAELFERGRDDRHPDWKSWQFPSSANPFLAQSEIDEAQRTSPERVFRQEWHAEFIDDGGEVIRKVDDAVRDCAAGPLEGHNYAFGVDWGKYNDFTVITVVDVDAREVVTVDRFNQIDYPFQRARLNALAQRFQPFVIVAERNSIGDPNIDDLRNEYRLPVQAFDTTHASKKQVIENLALGFENGAIGIPRDPVLMWELKALTIHRTPSGTITYAAPDGQHDDCVISLALAWSAVGYTGSDAMQLRQMLERDSEALTPDGRRNWTAVDEAADERHEEDDVYERVY